MGTELARKLRRTASPPERIVWKTHRPLRDQGWHFRRQAQIGSYYVDFVCMHPGLVIEVDGDTHGSDVAIGNDAVRDDYLRARGFRVLRVWNSDVMRNPAGVYEEVNRVLAEVSERGAPPTPSPSPQGGGERS